MSYQGSLVLLKIVFMATERWFPGGLEPTSG